MEVLPRLGNAISLSLVSHTRATASVPAKTTLPSDVRHSDKENYQTRFEWIRAQTKVNDERVAKYVANEVFWEQQRAQQILGISVFV